MEYPRKFTDLFFAKAIADLSADHTLYFTENQLYYLLNRRLKRKANVGRIGCLLAYLFPLFVLAVPLGDLVSSGQYQFVLVWLGGVAIWLTAMLFLARQTYADKKAGIDQRRATAAALQWMGILTIFVTAGVSLNYSPQLGMWWSVAGFVVNGILGGVAIALGNQQKSRLGEATEVPLVRRAQIREWLRQWTSVNGEVQNLLPPPLPTGTAAIASDVTFYSFDRLIVVETDAIAQILISNNLHMEYNAAILSICGYPQNIFSTVMAMLRRNQNLTVYTLHNASPQGVAMVHQLTTDPQWFAEQNVTVVDLGLLPRQILAKETYAIYTSQKLAEAAKYLPDEVRQRLSPEEIAWLEAGKFMEVEAFGSQKLLQVIRRGIALGVAADSEGLSTWDDGNSWMLMTTDSFG